MLKAVLRACNKAVLKDWSKGWNKAYSKVVLKDWSKGWSKAYSKVVLKVYWKVLRILLEGSNLWGYQWLIFNRQQVSVKLRYGICNHRLYGRQMLFCACW